MKKFIAFLSLLVTITLSCNKEKMFLTDELPSEEEALIDLAISEKAIMGIAAGYATIDNEWEYAAGLRNEETNQSFSTTTLTRLASIAKPMTAIAIMQLFEAGQLNLDSPIQE